MVIDTSALVAVLQDEPERRWFNEQIDAAVERRLSAAGFVETSIVIESRYGACFSYALARVLGEPLLFKGDDFSLTDLATLGS